MKKIILTLIFIMVSVVGLELLLRDPNQSMPAQESQEITAALEKFYAILDDADTSRYAEIMIDTADCRLDENTRQSIEQILGRDAARQAGYLTAMQAKGRLSSGAPPPVIYQSPTSKPGLMIESIKGRNDRAIVRYDDGQALQEAILIRKDGSWWVACVTAVYVHF